MNSCLREIEIFNKSLGLLYNVIDRAHLCGCCPIILFFGLVYGNNSIE